MESREREWQNGKEEQERKRDLVSWGGDGGRVGVCGIPSDSPGPHSGLSSQEASHYKESVVSLDSFACCIQIQVLPLSNYTGSHVSYFIYLFIFKISV